MQTTQDYVPASVMKKYDQECKSCRGLLRVHLSPNVGCTFNPDCASCVPCMDCLNQSNPILDASSKPSLKSPATSHPTLNSQHASSNALYTLKKDQEIASQELYSSGSMSDLYVSAFSLTNLTNKSETLAERERRIGRKKKGTSIIQTDNRSSSLIKENALDDKGSPMKKEVGTLSSMKRYRRTPTMEASPTSPHEPIKPTTDSKPIRQDSQSAKSPLGSKSALEGSNPALESVTQGPISSLESIPEPSTAPAMVLIEASRDALADVSNNDLAEKEPTIKTRRVSTKKRLPDQDQDAPRRANSARKNSAQHAASIELLADRATVRRNKPVFEHPEDKLGLEPSKTPLMHTSQPELSVPTQINNSGIPAPLSLNSLNQLNEGVDKTYKSIDIGSESALHESSASTQPRPLSMATGPSGLKVPEGKGKNRFSRSFDNFMKNIKSSPSDKIDTSLQPSTPPSATSGNDAAPSSANSNAPLSASVIASPAKKAKPGKSPGSSSIFSAGRRTSKNVKEWYANIAFDNQALDASMQESFEDDIDLKSIFGYKGNNEDLTFRLLQMAHVYDANKTLDIWNVRMADGNSKMTKHSGEEEIKYRVLNIFQDERLASLEFSAPSSDGFSYCLSGKPLDLLDGLIFPTTQDNSFAEVFLATFRFFMPAEKLLESLIEWYDVDLYEDCTAAEEMFLRRHRKAIQTRAIKVILLWVKNYWQDFANSKALEYELSDFVERLSHISFGDNQRMTQAIREQKLAWYTARYIPAFPMKKSNIPTNDPNKAMGLTWETVEFAKLLTLVDHFYYRQIKPDMYLHLMQSPVKKLGAAQNVALKVILDYVSWFSLVADYTSSLIIKEDTPKKRVAILKRFIKVAKECLNLHNFNTMFAIVSGIKRKGIINLTATWELLSTKHLELFRELEELTEPGSSKYWAELKTASPPLIPFFASYMQDLLEINQEAPTFVKSGSNPSSTVLSDNYIPDQDPLLTRSINFQKYYDLYSIIASMEKSRVASFDLTLNPPAHSANAQNVYMSSSHEYYGMLINHMKEWVAQNPFKPELAPVEPTIVRGRKPSNSSTQLPSGKETPIKGVWGGIH